MLVESRAATWTSLHLQQAYCISVGRLECDMAKVFKQSCNRPTMHLNHGKCHDTCMLGVSCMYVENLMTSFNQACIAGLHSHCPWYDAWQRSTLMVWLLYSWLLCMEHDLHVGAPGMCCLMCYEQSSWSCLCHTRGWCAFHHGHLPGDCLDQSDCLMHRCWFSNCPQYLAMFTSLQYLCCPI